MNKARSFNFNLLSMTAQFSRPCAEISVTNLAFFHLRPAYMEVGDPCKRGNPPVHIISYFNLDHVYMIGGVTRLGGLPGLPGRVTYQPG